MTYKKILFLIYFIASLNLYAMEFSREEEILDPMFKYNIEKISSIFPNINKWLLKESVDDYDLFKKIIWKWEEKRSTMTPNFYGIDKSLDMMKKRAIEYERRFKEPGYVGATYILKDAKEYDLYKNWPQELRSALEKFNYVKIEDYRKIYIKNIREDRIEPDTVFSIITFYDKVKTISGDDEEIKKFTGDLELKDTTIPINLMYNIVNLYTKDNKNQAVIIDDKIKTEKYLSKNIVKKLIDKKIIAFQ